MIPHLNVENCKLNVASFSHSTLNVQRSTLNIQLSKKMTNPFIPENPFAAFNREQRTRLARERRILCLLAGIGLLLLIHTICK